MVCEIGAGWAGFAYQFRTLFPPSRYVIVDFAELFLFSATYLGTLFPDARMAFCGTAETPTVADAGDADFIFVPHTMAAQVPSLPLDLTVNMVSFQEMTDGQVRAYADMAGDAGCPWLYSFNRDRSPFNTEIIERHRGAGRPLSAHRGVGAADRLHHGAEEAAQGRQERGAFGVQLPAPRGASGRRPRARAFARRAPPRQAARRRAATERPRGRAWCSA